MSEIDRLPSYAPDTLRAVEDVDIAVAQRAATIEKRPLVRWLGRASEMADQPPLVAISLATLAAGLLLRRPVLAVAGARMLATHAVATGMKAQVKRAVDRTRPYVLAEENRYVVRKGEENESRFNSFPSGHTAGAVAVAQAIARTHAPAGLPARLWAVAIAVIQIPRCAHYPSDVAAGAAIGLGADRLVRLAERGLGAYIQR
ncbi:phosphatase PAP2 family protein [Qipengyuania sediminis]|uniref:phosphatase PAP2 family protein n=1 Tax=Qipengyuania sediminis TaxID=1532023 RepID=UPI001404DD8E|nr:phosphatase PAP2 family protein [Qipengyuania sediminis]